MCTQRSAVALTLAVVPEWFFVKVFFQKFRLRASGWLSLQRLWKPNNHMQGQATAARTFAGDAASLFFSSPTAQASPTQQRKSGFARYVTPSYVPVEQSGDAEVIAAQLLRDSEMRQKIARLEFELQERERTIAQLKAESARSVDVQKRDEEEANIKRALDARIAASALQAVILSKRSEVEAALESVAQEVNMTLRSIEVHEQMLEKLPAPHEDRTYFLQLLSQKRAQLTSLRRKDAMLNKRHNLMLLATGAEEELSSDDDVNDGSSFSEHVRTQLDREAAARGQPGHELQGIDEHTAGSLQVGSNLTGIACCV